MSEELHRFVAEKLRLHREILSEVKQYIDIVLSEAFGIDPAWLRREDPATYYAITMELARSIMISWETEQRRRGRVNGGRG